MKKLFLSFVLLLFSATSLMAAEGIITVPSSYGVKETADRMEQILINKGMTVFNRINHSEGAGKIGIELRPTELLIFGNPKVGSPLMRCQQSVAIDLPQKALIWKDKNSKVWISYNDQRYLAKRHIISECRDVISKI